MRVLFICNTVYQIIVAYCIKKNILMEDFAELLVSDHTKNMKLFVERAEKNLKTFDSVRLLETKKYQDALPMKDEGEYKQNALSQLSELEIVEKHYDKVFFSNFDFFTNILIRHLNGKNKVQFCLFEDGLGTYCYEKKNFTLNRLKRVVKKILGKISPADYVKEFYVFRPESLEWETPGRVVQIPSYISDELKDELNDVFNYGSLKDNYDEKYIFFEDGFGEWGMREDLKVVQAIADIVGKEDIFVKTHPRNDVNFYKREGYKTNQDTAIPWEIIAMNLNLEGKRLITFYSQTVVTPFIMFGKKYRAIILSGITENVDEDKNRYFEYLNKFYYSKHQEVFFVPRTMDELKQYLEEKI